MNDPVPSTGLSDCSTRPNCVCTLASRDWQKMQPLSVQGSAHQALDVVEQQLTALPRVRRLSRNGNYLHLAFTSLIFRFTDDVEFWVDESAGLLHYRSASRVGYSDLGANRRRMQQVCELLTAQPNFASVPSETS